MVTQIKTIAAPKTIPYLREYPLVGSMRAFSTDRLNLLLRLAQAGDVCGFHFGPFPFIQFNRPEHVQSIMIEHAEDFDKGRWLRKAVSGNGIFISEGAFHHRQRKLMAPTFQPRHIVAYADTMTHYTEQFQEQWSDGTVIDLNQQMTSLTMSIICKVLFDADFLTEKDELGAALATSLAYSAYVLSSVFVLPLSWPTPRNRHVVQAEQLLEAHFQRMIDERRSSTIERNDFLSLLLQARDEDGSKMSDAQAIDECLTLFGAGHETTAIALIWAWYLLCQHPDIYQKLQQEVDSVLQGRTPTYADLPRLPYCLQVFKETMRLYSPGYTVSREALHDVEIDGYLVPKGAAVLVSSYTLHRRPEYFPEPERFEPERFTPEREKRLPRHAYIPFGVGPRICIGNHFALMEGQLLLATLAQRATFTLVPGQRIKPDPEHNFALRPNGKVKVVVKRRKRP
ncbi:MAG: cytochrome P450 [Ktedonobacteraceae bacterium]|nr:cytochrome P450 [Ktedonobacteraceae bacterium]